MIYHYFRVTGAHDTVLDFVDLFSVTIHDDKIQEFDTRWVEVLLSKSKIPSDDFLESLYKLRIHKSKAYWNCTTWTFIGRYRIPIIKKLKTMVRRNFNQKLRLRSFDAIHEKIETGAVVKNRKGLSGVEGGKGICHQWKEKGQCLKGDPMQFPA